METCGRTPGPVPNAGGAPAGCCCEGSCASAGATPAALAAAAAKLTAVSVKNSRRVFAMWPPPGILPGHALNALAFICVSVEFFDCRYALLYWNFPGLTPFKLRRRVSNTFEAAAGNACRVYPRELRCGTFCC